MCHAVRPADNKSSRLKQLRKLDQTETYSITERHVGTKVSYAMDFLQ